MANSKIPTVPVIVISAMVLVAIVLGLTHYRLPGRHVNLATTNTTNSSETTNAGESTNSANATNTKLTPESMSKTNTMPTYTNPGKLPADQIHNKQARIVTNKGTIVFTLDDAQSPLAVSSFVYLANQGYFDGLTWHRVIADFVIQGGDPTGTGSGGPGYQFADEPVTGEYTEGTVAMANAGPNTNGSQFFICNADDTAKLAKSYSIFGHVTQGLDVVKAIVQGDRMTKVTIESVS